MTLQGLPKGLELRQYQGVDSVLLHFPEAHIEEFHLGSGHAVRPSRMNPQDIFYVLEGQLGESGIQGHCICGENFSESMFAPVSSRYLHFSTYPQLEAVKHKRVEFESGSIQLLFANASHELSIMTLNPDMRMFIVPPEQASTKEFYYILEGELLLHSEQDYRLGPGDSILVQDLEAPVVFKGLTDTKLLFFSTQPAFEVVSQDIQGLMQLAEDIEQKDGYTADHCARIQTLALRTAEYINLPHERIYFLSYAAYLHDIGKINIPLSILQKPGKLSYEEWHLMKQHPTQGKEIIQASFPEHVGLMIEQHHERLDGSGYPKGLKNQDILTEAFIIAIADTFDAMTTDRSYRKALDKQVALDELHRFSGVHYPRDLVEAFIKANQL